MSFTFIYADKDSPKSTEVNTDSISLEEVLEDFKNFLSGCGYYIQTSSLLLIDDEDNIISDHEMDNHQDKINILTQIADERLVRIHKLKRKIKRLKREIVDV